MRPGQGPVDHANGRRTAAVLRVRAVRDAHRGDKACEQADVVLHLTEWPQHRDLDPAALAAVVRTPAIVDARNTLDPAAWHAAVWTLRAPGRPRLC
nr:UDP binding domain-containing protein [Streptomyces sp. NBC_00886]